MFRRTTLPIAALAVLSIWAGTARAEGPVTVAVLTPENYDELAPRGKEVDAIYGDVVIRNDHVIAVVAQPKGTRHANMTVRDVGGQLIDLTTPDSQSDQLSAYFVGRRRYPFRKWHLLDADNGRVEVGEKTRVSGRTAKLVVEAEAVEGRPSVGVLYRLRSDDKALTISVDFENEGEKAVTVLLEDDTRIDSRNERIRFERNGLHDLFWAHDRHWGQAYVFEHNRGTIKSTTTRGVVLEFSGKDLTGSPFGPKVVLPKGAFDGYALYVYPGRDLLEAKARAYEYDDEFDLQPVTIRVLDGAGRALPEALVTVEHEGKPYGAATTDARGRIDTKLPQGDCELSVTTLGVRVGTYEVSVGEGENDLTVETAFTPGVVAGKVVDGDGRPVPAKIEFQAKGDAADPDFGPHSATRYVGNLVYTVDGTFERTVPPGDYRVVVSHGPEYDAHFGEISVEPGGTVDVRATLERVVDTAGWVSADYHSHSSPSGDNTSDQRGRIYNLVCEHVEFAPCTEHNRISTYDGHIAALGVVDRIRTVSGMELTGRPLPLNHQNVFPLVHRPRTQDGGAPVTDVDVERQVERLVLWDDRSEKLIQQNHPDVGWLFYDRNGDGEPDEGHARIRPHVDVMEIHPIDAVIGLDPVDRRDGKPFGNNRMVNWLQMLNQGSRIRGVVNTDAHYNFHGSGGLRNWIRSSTDDPAKIDLVEMRENSEAGRIVMSNGPFLELTAKPVGSEKLAEIGDRINAPTGEVEVRVRVQCPNWLDVDHVYLLVNGRISEQFDFRPGDSTDVFGNGGEALRFDETRTVKLPEDAHLIAVAVGEKQTVGKVMGPAWGKQRPAAVTNPIFVDVDGDGFRPNGDTLGSPLPVKFGTRG